MYMFDFTGIGEALRLTNAKIQRLKQPQLLMTDPNPRNKTPANLPKLQKFLADSGLCSRRKGETWIGDGLVTVNEEIAKLGCRVNPNKDVVKVKGRRVQAHTQPSLTLMVNKPKGFICSNEDEHADRLIFDILEKKHQTYRLFCAGRLDLESEGLVILTNDGSLAHRLTHPSNEVKKRYQVELNLPLAKEHLPLIIKGATIDEEFLRIDDIRAKNGKPIGSLRLELTLGHGKKREIRRIFQHFGYRISKLRRVAIGGLSLHKLPLGQYRELERKEIGLLFPREIP
jgi:23S rRNA pseudouridine2605 synthase